MSNTRKDDKGKKKGILGVFGGKNKKDAAEAALPSEKPAIEQFKEKFKQKVTSNLSAFNQFAEFLKIYASFQVAPINERAQIVTDESCRTLIIPIVKAVTNCDNADKSLPYFKEGLADRLTGNNKSKFHTAMDDLFYQPEILKVINNGAFVKRQLSTEELKAFLSLVQQLKSNRPISDVASRKISQLTATFLGDKQDEKIKQIEAAIKNRGKEDDFEKDSLSESDTTSSSAATPDLIEKLKVATAKNSPPLERREPSTSVYATPQEYRTPAGTPTLSRTSTEGSAYETPRGSMSLTQADLGVAPPPLPTTPPPSIVEKKGPPPPTDIPPPPVRSMPQPSLVSGVAPAVNIPPPPPPPSSLKNGAPAKPATLARAKPATPTSSSPRSMPSAAVSGVVRDIAAQAAAARASLRKAPVKDTVKPIAEDTLQPLTPTSTNEVTVAIHPKEEKKDKAAKPEIATKESANKLVYEALIKAQRDNENRHRAFFADYAMSLLNGVRLSKENFDALDEKQKTFLSRIHELAVSMKSFEDQQKFEQCAKHLNQLVLDVFNPDQTTKVKEASLSQFVQASAEYVMHSYDAENEAARKRYNIITCIATAAAILIGAAVAIGVGIVITLLTGGALTVPYFMALSTQTVAIYGAASAAGVLGAGGLTFGLFKKFQSADKSISSEVQTAVKGVDIAAADLLGAQLRK